ncbi:hypothetical protein WMY93_006333, partial [Mugilogobius chulae]
AAGQKAKVPEPALSKTSPGLLRHHLRPTSPSTLFSSSPPGNGKSALSIGQLQNQTSPLSQCQLPSVSARYPPREVPPRFRQQEQKQLLKRGQPLPPGALKVLTILSSAYSATVTSSTNSATTTASKQLTDIPQSGLGDQHETCHWGESLPIDDSFIATTWNKVIIDTPNTDSWPSVRGSSDSCHPSAAECPLGSASSDDKSSANTTTKCSSFLSMATGAAGHQAHYPALKSNNNMMTGSASTLSGSRGWGSEGKQDAMNGSRIGAPNNWGSSNFNLNLNPNANPSAWPVLGHESSGSNGSNGLSNSPSITPGIKNNGNIAVSDASGGGWAGMMTAKEMDQHPSTTTCLSFNMEPSNLNSDGPNHSKQQHQTQEPMSPIHGMTGWGGQSPTESSQLNGDTTGSSVWGTVDTKAADSTKDSGWDSNPSGALSAWDVKAVEQGVMEVVDGETGESQDQPLSTWGQQPGTAPASEGSGDSSEGRSRRRDRSYSMEIAPVLPRQDLDPRVLSNTGWGQTPIRQHTVWEMEEASSDDSKSCSSSETLGSSGSNHASSPTCGGNVITNMGPGPRPGSGGKNDSDVSVSSNWGGPQSMQSGSEWSDPPQSKAQNGTPSGWGDPMPVSGPNSGGSSWGSEDKSPSWDDGMTKSQPTTWTEGSSSSHGWGNSNGNLSSSSTGEWGEPEAKSSGNSSSMWEGDSGNAGSSGWKDSARAGNRGGGWGKQAPPVNNSWGIHHVQMALCRETGVPPNLKRVAVAAQAVEEVVALVPGVVPVL